MSQVQEISAEQVIPLLEKGAKLIDVREPAEFRSAYIEGAELHPLGTIDSDALKANNEQMLIIYCQKGVRGKKACQKILAQSPNRQTVNLQGGIEAWQNAGFQTKKGKSKILSLDRQVQLTIGTIVLSFSLLTLFVHSGFIFVPAFFGAGLIFAGLSGFCGLARLLALAPWNK